MRATAAAATALLRATGRDCLVKSWPTSQESGRRRLCPPRASLMRFRPDFDLTSRGRGHLGQFLGRSISPTTFGSGWIVVQQVQRAQALATLKQGPSAGPPRPASAVPWYGPLGGPPGGPPPLAGGASSMRMTE